MRFYDIIAQKQRGIELSDESIQFFIKGCSDGSVPDYQLSALLMAIWFKGMSDKETASLTSAMANSGEIMDLSKIDGIKVDKHSTGGVGDKTTLIVAPIVAACGVKVAKMSGRGLGHTGGTLDKLESISGFSCNIMPDDVIAQVNDIGICICAQTGNLVPADKTLYALRDVTATVDSIPLIASSVMSKKLAAGCDKIVLDVKVGSGAFMKSDEDAIKLAQAMVNIGKIAGKETVALVTNMDIPLGKNIGNALEVQEAIDVLQNTGPLDLKHECVMLATQMLELAGIDNAALLAEQSLTNGSAYKKFVQFVLAQGGSEESLQSLPNASIKHELLATEKGYIAAMDTEKVGIASSILGAGRMTSSDKIDFSAGIEIIKKTGDYVNIGDTICVLHTNDSAKLSQACATYTSALALSCNPPEPSKLLIACVKN